MMKDVLSELQFGETYKQVCDREEKESNRWDAEKKGGKYVGPDKEEMEEHEQNKSVTQFIFARERQLGRKDSMIFPAAWKANVRQFSLLSKRVDLLRKLK